MEMFDQESGSRESSGRVKQLQKQKGCARMNKFDMMSKDALSKMEELMNASKLNELLHKKEEEDKKKTCILWILAIIGIVAAVAAVAYAVYRYLTPDYLEDFDDDFDDDFEDEDLDKEEPEKEASEEKKED